VARLKPRLLTFLQHYAWGNYIEKSKNDFLRNTDNIWFPIDRYGEKTILSEKTYIINTIIQKKVLILKPIKM